MPTRRQLFAMTALVIAAQQKLRAAAQEPPTGNLSAFNWESMSGLEGTGRRHIAAAGRAAAQAAKLTDITFFVARFASAALGEDAYPMVEAFLLAPAPEPRATRQVVTASSFEDQSSGYIGLESSHTPLHAALLVRDGRDIHLWEGTVSSETVEWEDAPSDPTVFLMGLVAIAERMFTEDRTEPESIASALPSGSQMPIGFTIISETIEEPE